MDKYINLKKAVNWVSEFESQLPSGEDWNDVSFANWLLREVSKSNEQSVVTTKSSKAIPMFLVFMYKYASFYARKILKKSKIYSFEDFSFLASLLPDKQLKKADVIRKNIAEKSSGNEVLKRLIKQKMIVESDNPCDKRSKLLMLTPVGFQEINAVRSQFEKMGALVTGDLNDEEKNILASTLTKLHLFHNPLFLENDEAKINELIGP